MKNISKTSQGNFFNENGEVYIPLDGQKFTGWPMFQTIRDTNIPNQSIITMRHIEDIEQGDIVKHTNISQILFYRVVDIIEKRPAINASGYKGQENTFFKLLYELV